MQNHGYIGLYDGLGAQDIHTRKGLKKGQRCQQGMAQSFSKKILLRQK